MALLPDEARLLFMASRPDAISGETYLAALVASRPDWRVVGALAEREKLLPILWAYMRDHAELIPADIRKSFRAQAAVTEFRMALTESALAEVLRRLGTEGIPVMLLKGAALATTVYGSFLKRPMGDFDVLVRAADAERAWRIMRAEGWRLELEGGDQFYESHHHLPALLDPRGINLVLEIHRAMLPPTGPFVLDEAELWREAKPVKVGGAEGWVPSDCHQLLHLSVHFAWSNMFGGIGRTVRDVATMLAAGSFDWGRFTSAAMRARAATCAYWTLAITKALSGTAVPRDVLEQLRPAWPEPVLRSLERAYISIGLLRGCPSVLVTKRLWEAGIQPGRSGHGPARPWQANELFGQAFHLAGPTGMWGRVSEQLRSGGRWWQFVKSVGLPGRSM